MWSQSLIGTIWSSKWSAVWLATSLLIGYAAPALVVNWLTTQGEYYLQLALLTTIGSACILLGSRISLFGNFSPAGFGCISIRLDSFLIIAWLSFCTFAIVAWTTASKIPIVSSFQCFDAEQISVHRELFLKARMGWESGLVYINGLLMGAIIPYALALMFVHNTRFRWLCLTFFLVYSVSFLEKAFFLKALLPAVYLLFQGRIKTKGASIGLPLSIIVLLLLLTYTASGLCSASTSSSIDITQTAPEKTTQLIDSSNKDSNAPTAFNPNYMTAGYQPSGTVDHLVWRAIAVPLFTAKDALKVFHEHFDSQPLLGATSTLLAAMFNRERVPYERIVFERQWGQNKTATGSANSVYVTEAFVNFGLFGVIIISLLIGQMLRWFAVSTDIAFQSLWPILALDLYVSGFIGVTLSNGFALIFLIALLVRWRTA